MDTVHTRPKPSPRPQHDPGMSPEEEADFCRRLDVLVGKVEALTEKVRGLTLPSPNESFKSR